MPSIVLERPALLPVAELQKRLSQVLPQWRWRVGDDVGIATLSLERPATILGMAGPDIFMMAVERVDRPLPLEVGAPPHQLHIKLSQPSTEDQELAGRLLLLTAAAILEKEEGSAQLTEHGPWYNSAELIAAATMLTRDPVHNRVHTLLAGSGEKRAAATAAPDQGYQPPPPGSPDERIMLADIDHSFAKILTELGGADLARSMGRAPPPPYAEEEPRSDRLPTFVLALSRPLEFDWSPVMDIGRLDPPGNWTAQPGPDGTGTLTGRNCTVKIEAHPDPIPGYMLENALARSFWFQSGRPAFSAQRSSLIVTCDLDTRAAPYEDVRETAKVMTLLLGLLTRAPGCIAVLNNGVHTLLEPAMVQSQVGHLHKNRIPLMLWTWTAPDSMVQDAVSLSSGGLLPFLGFEVEVWNAPGDPNWVGDKMSQIINYLLHIGPERIHDGDSFGEEAGDRSIRGFFSTTKAQRYDTNIKALMLEFAGPTGAAPKPDKLPDERPPGAAATTQAPASPAVDLVSVVAMTKPTVFPTNIIQEMLETGFPGMKWTITPGEESEPHLIEGVGDEGKAVAFVSAYGLTIPRDLSPPPHRLHLTVALGAHGDTALARRVSLVICSCLIISLDRDAHFQLSADGNWLSHDDAMTGVVVPRHTKDIGDFDQVFGTSPDGFRGAANPSDAYPPAPDDHFREFRRISVSRGAHSGQRPEPSPPPPTRPPSPGGFGRRLFGRKT